MLFIFHNRCAFDVFIVVVPVALIEHQDDGDDDDQDAHTVEQLVMFLLCTISSLACHVSVCLHI